MYRTESIRISSGRDLVLWIPLVDGIGRNGELRVIASNVDAAGVEHALASLIALLVAAKSLGAGL